MKISGIILKARMADRDGNILESIPEITIGGPIKHNSNIIGKIVSAEVDGDCVIATAELNNKGKIIFEQEIK
jgi:hypothetical protein